MDRHAAEAAGAGDQQQQEEQVGWQGELASTAHMAADMWASAPLQMQRRNT